MSLDLVAQRVFAGLVERAGGVEAAAAILSARAGRPVHKSTISRMGAGQMAVTFEAAAALEEAVGVFPLTTLLFERIGRRAAASGSLQTLCASASVECGEAVASIIAAFSARSADPSRLTEAERAEAVKEVSEALAVLREILDALEAGSADGGGR
ncbi:MAG: hypothetical protein ACE37J_14000 [Pikeienuella sp.]|uniref:hypothetical protein n=1 Tax=Pikeienuella sp. TaxID=2831957 RepID=UPI00391DA865